MRAFAISVLFFSLSACGGGEDEVTTPEPAAQTTGGSNAVAQRSREIDEGRAVEIAMHVAEERGYDTMLYEDIVVDDGGDSWVVQMRQPMIREFLLVTVRKSDGSAVLETVTR